MKKISIVISCYNKGKVLPLFYNEIKKIMLTMEYLDYEIILVNDGSTDETLEIFKVLNKKDGKTKYISFSRNFGKEAAMYAGLKESTGDFIAIMDTDIQDSPSQLIEMYRLICEEGYDLISNKIVYKKSENKLGNFVSKKLHKIINKINIMSNINIVHKDQDFKLMTRQVVNSILEISEYRKFSKDVFDFVGYNTKCLPYENVKVKKWSLKNLFKESVEKINNFSKTPLVAISYIGILLFLISIVGIISLIIKDLFYDDMINGWISKTCIILFVSGIQLLSIGVIGQYLVKIYSEVKRGSLYIIKERSKEIEQ